MKVFQNFHNSLKITFSILCTILFLMLMEDVWNKYSSNFSRTGIRVRYSSEESKQLPCITLCPTPGFKVKGFFYQQNLVDQNSFSLEDMFAPKTVAQLRNSSTYSLKTTCSQLLGCCTTICPHSLFPPKNGPFFHLKTNLDFKAFVHNNGTEFWFTGFNQFPYDIPYDIIEASNPKGMIISVMSINEFDTTVLTKNEEPCNFYYGRDDLEFIDCCKLSIRKHFKNPYSCMIQEMKSIVPQDLEMNECPNTTIAGEVLWSYSAFMSGFTVKPWSYGCPIPCKLKSYKFTINSLHTNTRVFPLYEPEDHKYFIFTYYFASLNVEERIESLEYDFGNLLVAAGGNLGLFLGFSCLTVLFAIIDFIKNL